MTDTAALASVTIVVVTHQSAHCLARLGALLGKAPNVVVVDNASTDGTAAAVAQHLPQAQLIHNTHNTGFGAANNAGLAEVRTPYALLLNPDCEVTTDAISALHAAQQRFPEAGMLAPQIIDGNGLPEINYRWPSTLWRSKGPGATGPCCVGFLCGAIIWLNLSKTRPLGHFDTHFFLYYEEYDWCARIKAAGFDIYFCGESLVYHKESMSVGKASPLKTYYMTRNRIWFAQRNLKGVSKQLTLLYLYAVALPKQLLLTLFQKRWDLFRAAWRGAMFKPSLYENRNRSTTHI